MIQPKTCLCSPTHLCLGNEGRINNEIYSTSFYLALGVDFFEELLCRFEYGLFVVRFEMWILIVPPL